MQSVVLPFALFLFSISGASAVEFSDDQQPLKFVPMVKKEKTPVARDEKSTKSTLILQPRDSTTEKTNQPGDSTTTRAKQPRMFDNMPREERTMSTVNCDGKVTVSPGVVYTFSAPAINVDKCRYKFKNPGNEMLNVTCQGLDFDRCKSSIKIRGESGKYCDGGDFSNVYSYSPLVIIFKNKKNKPASFTCSVFIADELPTTMSTTTAQPSSDCTCGQRPMTTRIVGGSSVPTNSIPWQVGVLTNCGTCTTPWCGGTIINEFWVLTAAHCTDGEVASGLKVVVGEHNHIIVGDTDVEEYIEVAQIVEHNSYNSATLDNDIALLRLSSAISFDDPRVAPVCLPADASQDYANVNGLVTGWGLLRPGGWQPAILYGVTVPVISNAECIQKLGSGVITSNMLCAGYDQGGKDSCQGDSGGPIVYNTGTHHEIIGIVSWGYGCAEPNQPGVYTRVTNYLNWIQSVTGGGDVCLPL